MDCSTLGFSVLHCLPECAQTHVHWVCDAIQPSLVAPFSSCSQSFPASGSFPKNNLRNLTCNQTRGGGRVPKGTAVSLTFPASLQLFSSLGWEDVPSWEWPCFAKILSSSLSPRPGLSPGSSSARSQGGQGCPLPCCPLWPAPSSLLCRAFPRPLWRQWVRTRAASGQDGLRGLDLCQH